MTTAEVTRTLVPQGLHQGTIAKVQKGFSKYLNNRTQQPKVKYTLFIEYPQFKGENDKYNPSVRMFIDEGALVYETTGDDGKRNKRRSRAGKYAEALVGPLPCPTYFEQFDWEALEGLTIGTFVMHNTGQDGKTYANVETISMPEQEDAKQLLELRKPILYKQNG